MKKYISEFIGTAILVIFGCGSAITNGYGGGYIGIALSFGLVIVAMAYSIGNISGCHINPAVSLAMLISKKMSVKDFIGYVISQVLGAIAGAALLMFLFGTENGLGTNAYGSGTDANLTLIQALIAEIVLTFTFVMTILGVTSKKEYSSIAGVVIGLSLTLVHIMGLPLTGTSVNPARSIGPALFMGGEALSQIWLFIVAPLIGAAIAAVLYNFLSDEKGVKN
ncbi:MAG: MIP family channel protein [Clostridia bacterium]|nr:MIP family channel protein [Clostridia bacterium]